CPNIIYFLAKLYQSRKKRINVGLPQSSIELATIESAKTSVDRMQDDCNITTDPQPINSFSTLLRGIMFGIFLLILMVMAIIITSICLNRQNKNNGSLT
ncbi:unnamed protein product, partial [Adineta steineri]